MWGFLEYLYGSIYIAGGLVLIGKGASMALSSTMLEVLVPDVARVQVLHHIRQYLAWIF